MDKHKVFISYHHDLDQDKKETLLELNKVYDLFDDYSVSDGEIDDNLSAEQIRIKIRDNFIRNAKVLILLCGQKTKNRKHIDWEINAAMFNTELNPRLGIVVINLPSITNSFVRASTDEEKELISPESRWMTLNTREEYVERYPYMPERIIDNFVKDVPISVVDWNRIYQNPLILKKLVDNAFNRRKDISYDHSRPIRRNNS